MKTLSFETVDVICAEKEIKNCTTVLTKVNLIISAYNPKDGHQWITFSTYFDPLNRENRKSYLLIVTCPALILTPPLMALGHLVQHFFDKISQTTICA